MKADRYDTIALGVPAGVVDDEGPLRSRLAAAFPGCQVVSYRDRLGQHASIGATAVALAAHGVATGDLPFATEPSACQRVLLLQLGARATAVEVFA